MAWSGQSVASGSFRDPGPPGRVNRDLAGARQPAQPSRWPANCARTASSDEDYPAAGPADVPRAAVLLHAAAPGAGRAARGRFPLRHARRILRALRLGIRRPRPGGGPAGPRRRRLPGRRAESGCRLLDRPPVRCPCLDRSLAGRAAGCATTPRPPSRRSASRAASMPPCPAWRAMPCPCWAPVHGSNAWR